MVYHSYNIPIFNTLSYHGRFSASVLEQVAKSPSTSEAPLAPSGEDIYTVFEVAVPSITTLQVTIFTGSNFKSHMWWLWLNC